MRRLVPLLLATACAVEDPASLEEEANASTQRVDPQSIHPARQGNLLFINSDPMVCWVLQAEGYGRIRVDAVGMESARIDILQEITIPSPFSWQQITKVGDQLAITGSGHSGPQVVLLDALTGQLLGHHPVEAYHLFHGGSYIWGDFGVSNSARRYDSPLDAYRGVGTDVSLPNGTGLGNGSDWLATWSIFTGRVRLFDPATVTLDRTIRLRGLEGNIQALQQTPDHVVVLDDGSSNFAPGDQVLSVFDLTTGADQTHIVLPQPLATGFICEGGLP